MFLRLSIVIATEPIEGHREKKQIYGYEYFNMNRCMGFKGAAGGTRLMMDKADKIVKESPEEIKKMLGVKK